MALKKGTIVDGQIKIENAFPSFPWDKIKNQIITSFENLGPFALLRSEFGRYLLSLRAYCLIVSIAV